MEFASPAERTAARKLVSAALQAGYKISVNDGEEWVVRNSTNSIEVLEALCSTGSDTLRMSLPDGTFIATFWLVWGNGGEELVADFSDNATARTLMGWAFK